MTSRRFLVGLLTVAAGLAAPAPSWGIFPATDVFIPSAGRGPGLSGSQWYTTVWVYNPGASPVPVAYSFLLRDQANPASPYVLLDVIQPGETRRYVNAVESMFGVQGFGAIRAVADLPLVVNSRIFSLPEGGLDRDTVGQFLGAVPAAFAVGKGQTTQLLGAFDTSLDGESEFRYNFGLVETTGEAATTRVTVLDDLGAELVHADLALGPYEVRQYGLRSVFPMIGTTNARLAITVTAGSGRVIAFGSCLANRSNDPSTFEMRFDESMLAAASAVVHDASLTGDGTGPNPLGVADGGVGKSKLAASGGTTGQVLGTDGTGLQWQDAGGLTLPFSSSVDTGDLRTFSITNAGGGAAISGSGLYTGVLGYATATGGTHYGQAVYGVLWGDHGYAVRGEAVSASSSTASGVYGSHGNLNSGHLGGFHFGAWGRHGASGNYGALGAATQAAFARAYVGHGLEAESAGNGLSAAAVLARAVGASGIALHATASSSDSSLVVTNQGGGDLVRAFANAGELRFRITNAGNVSADGTFSPGGADFAELVPAADEDLTPGEVLVVRADGRFGRSTLPFQAGVAGVVSSRPGVQGDYWRGLGTAQKVSLAVVGIVPVRVCDEAGAIGPGDQLTTSSTPGVAMRASRYEPGTVVGTALAAHRAGVGVVPVLVRSR